MKNKRLYKHLTCFFADHLWVVCLFLAAPAAIMFCYLMLAGESSDGGSLYYIFLSLFVLMCFLLYRLYATWDYYEILCKDHKTLEDFLLIDAPKSREEEHYSRLLREYHQLLADQLEQMSDHQRQNKIMIYRWVHQLKTPLSVISLIASNRKNDPDFQKVMQAAGQIQYDLDQVLNMYKLDDIKNDFHAEKIFLRSLCKDCINELKSSFITKEIYPKLDIPDNPVVFSDSKWLKFVLYQLLTNALKYSDKGERIIICTKSTEKGIALSVRDYGCGIAPGDRKRIYDLFFTGQNGRSRGESSGLGLYMVKQILDYLGHSISVSSEPGAGSTFTIFFQSSESITDSESSY